MIPQIHLPEPTGEPISALSIHITDEHGNPEPFKNTAEIELFFADGWQIKISLDDAVAPEVVEYLRTNQPVLVKLTHVYPCPRPAHPLSDAVIDALKRWDKNGSLEVKQNAN